MGDLFNIDWLWPYNAMLIERALHIYMFLDLLHQIYWLELKIFNMFHILTTVDIWKELSSILHIYTKLVDPSIYALEID